MDNELRYKVIKVVVILVLGALAVYILITTVPLMLEEMGTHNYGHRSHLFTDFIFLVLILPIAFIIIGIIRSWK